VQSFYLFANADELINCPDIDAVYIATPPDSHLALALKVAEAGKPCCIEKPLAPTYQQSKQIMDTFAAKNIAVFVAYYRRSLPRFNKVKALIDDAAIGSVRHISWHLNKPANPLDLSGTYNWRTRREFCGATHNLWRMLGYAVLHRITQMQVFYDMPDHF